jgi:hypothetical protein
MTLPLVEVLTHCAPRGTVELPPSEAGPGIGRQRPGETISVEPKSPRGTSAGTCPLAGRPMRDDSGPMTPKRLPFSSGPPARGRDAWGVTFPADIAGTNRFETIRRAAGFTDHERAQVTSAPALTGSRRNRMRV